MFSDTGWSLVAHAAGTACLENFSLERFEVLRVLAPCCMFVLPYGPAGCRGLVRVITR